MSLAVACSQTHYFLFKVRRAQVIKYKPRGICADVFKKNEKKNNTMTHSHDTVLSKYIWELKDNDTTYDIKWRIRSRGQTPTRENRHTANFSLHTDVPPPPEKIGGGRLYTGYANFCLSEKLCILNARDTLLNKRSKLVTKCRHKSKFFTINHRTCCSNRPS